MVSVSHPCLSNTVLTWSFSKTKRSIIRNIESHLVEQLEMSFFPANFTSNLVALRDLFIDFLNYFCAFTTVDLKHGFFSNTFTMSCNVWTKQLLRFHLWKDCLWSFSHCSNSFISSFVGILSTSFSVCESKSTLSQSPSSSECMYTHQLTHHLNHFPTPFHDYAFIMLLSLSVNKRNILCCISSTHQWSFGVKLQFFFLYGDSNLLTAKVILWCFL